MLMSKNQSTKEEIIFKPRYPFRVRLTVYLAPLGLLACVFFTWLALITGRLFPNLLFAFIFGFTTISMPMIIFREARFGEAIVVKRYFLPRIIIQYKDVTGWGPRGLSARHGGIPLANVQNSKEFEAIIQRLAAQRKINLSK
jgi:hypothetical protein